MILIIALVEKVKIDLWVKDIGSVNWAALGIVIDASILINRGAEVGDAALDEGTEVWLARFVVVKGAKPVGFRLLEVSLVNVAVGPEEAAETATLTLVHLADVEITLAVNDAAVAVQFSFFPSAFHDRAVKVLRGGIVLVLLQVHHVYILEYSFIQRNLFFSFWILLLVNIHGTSILLLHQIK